MLFVCSFVLQFYGPVNPVGSCRVCSIYLIKLLLGRLSFKQLTSIVHILGCNLKTKELLDCVLISAQSSNFLIFRLQTVYFYLILYKKHMLYEVICSTNTVTIKYLDILKSLS